jgi:hypothetical protein
MKTCQMEAYNVIDDDELRDAARFVAYCPMSDLTMMAEDMGVDRVWLAAQVETYMMRAPSALQ